MIKYEEKLQNVEQMEMLVRELGVFELRGLAREFGINSPTTKKRDELIDLIMKVLHGEKNNEAFNRRKGRPYKKISTLNDIINSMINKSTNTAKTPELVFENVSVFNFAQDVPDFSLMLDDSGEFVGYARKTENRNSSIYDKKYEKWIYIREDLRFFNKIYVGDKVKLKAQSLSNENQYVATEIIEINDVNAEEYMPKLKEKNEGNEIISNEKIPFGEGYAFVGRRNVFDNKQDLYENDNFKNLTTFCKQSGYKLLLLGVNISFESEIALKNIGNFIDFTTVYGTKNIINFNQVIDAINNCQNLLNRGEKVVLFVTDVMEVLNCLDECFEQEEDHLERAKVVMRKLLSLGRAFDDGRNCTLIMGYSKYDLSDKFLTSEILKISKEI